MTCKYSLTKARFLLREVLSTGTCGKIWTVVLNAYEIYPLNNIFNEKQLKQRKESLSVLVAKFATKFSITLKVRVLRFRRLCKF